MTVIPEFSDPNNMMLGILYRCLSSSRSPALGGAFPASDWIGFFVSMSDNQDVLVRLGVSPRARSRLHPDERFWPQQLRRVAAAGARGDGCTRVQLGKIMNEVDCGWQRPSLKRNGSQQRVGILTGPSPPLPSSLPPYLKFVHTAVETHCRPEHTLIRRFALAHVRGVPEAPAACSSISCMCVLEARLFLLFLSGSQQMGFCIPG